MSTDDRTPPFPIAVFDEFGRSIDDKVQDYAHARAAAATLAERERAAKVCEQHGTAGFSYAAAIRKGD